MQAPRSGPFTELESRELPERSELHYSQQKLLPKLLAEIFILLLQAERDGPPIISSPALLYSAYRLNTEERKLITEGVQEHQHLVILNLKKEKEHTKIIMKILPALFLAIFLAGTVSLHAEEVPAPLPASTVQSGDLIIHITGLRKIVGQLGVSLYNSSKGFPGDYSTVYAKTLKQVTGTTDEVRFTNLPYGSYAISVLHDENSNGKLDTTFLIGIPKEGIGVSNNPKARRGPPKYNECTFALDSKQLETTVSMRYF